MAFEFRGDLEERNDVHVNGKTPAIVNETISKLDEEGAIPKLLSVSLNQDGLYEIPEPLEKLASCTLMTLNGNHLKSFDRLCSLDSLVHLYINANKIEKIPEQISRLQKLRSLDLGQSCIKYLGKSFFQLPLLTTVYLYNNEISRISSHCTNLKNLNIIYLNGNRLPGTFNKIVARQEIPEFLLDVSKHFSYLETCEKSCLCLIWIRKNFKNECGWLAQLPLDLVKIIAMFLYSTRLEDCWKPN